MRLRPSLPFPLVGALGLFAITLGGVLTVGCQSEQQNGQECLKNDDCESKRCVQYVCVDPASGKTAIDSGTTPVDAPADVAPETTAETAATDTGTAADTTATDTAGD